MLRYVFGLRLCMVMLIAAFASAAQATDAGWALLRNGGHVVLLRNAYSNGSVEPPSFDIAKCATQLNLSERGKQQARKIGALFAARAAPVEAVLSSLYCRCLDTARLAFEAEPEAFDPLDKWTDANKATRQAAVLARIRDFSGSDNLVMITHLENIRDLTGISPREGEAVIVAPNGDGLRVLGRIVF